MTEDPTEFDAVPATTKVLRVLELVARTKGATVTDVMHATGMPKSTVVRLLSTLLDEGFLARRAKEFIPAVKLWELGCEAVHWEDVRDTVFPSLRRLVTVTDETAHYAVYDDGRAVYVDKFDGPQPVRAYTRVGGTSPAYATATGKVLLAWQSEAEMRRVLDAAERHTPATIVDSDRLVAVAAGIRQQGYATNAGEWREGVWGIAAPVFDRHNEVAGAIGVSGPAERIEPHLGRLAATVAEEARTLSRGLGADQ